MKFEAAFNQGGQFPTIGVVNLSTIDLGLPLPNVVGVLQKYSDLVATIWGYPVKFVSYPDVASIPADQWQFLFIDDADTAGALGYHDLTKNGQPVAKVFTKTTVADKEDIIVTATHEAAEMTIDPGAQLWAQGTKKLLYAYELSDPVEEDTFPIDGVQVSNFVYPSWFENWKHAAGTKYDYMGRLKAPFTMTKGGYLITMKNGKVGQVFGSVAKEKRFAKTDRVGHRAEHRKALAGQRAQLIRA